MMSLPIYDGDGCAIVLPTGVRIIDLSDTPMIYGSDGQVLAMNSALNGVEWIDVSAASAGKFIQLSDTPLTYGGGAGKILAIKQTEDGIEFVDLPNDATWGNITGTITDQTDLQNELNTKAPISHLSDYDNPHNVNKGDVGLSNVNNTSDNNKPISSDVQTALNNKENAFTKHTAFNKNFGTNSTDVARGNHNHSTSYEPKNSNIQSHISNNGIHLTSTEKSAVVNANSPGGSNPFATMDDIGAAGGGDMVKAVYDSNGNNYVDDADNQSVVAGALVSDALNNLYAQLNPPSLSGFNFTGRSTYIKVGTSLSNLHFYWSTNNSPTNIKISDNKGIMGNVGVSGVSYNGNKNYSYSNNTSVTWTIIADGGLSASTNTRWVYPSYFGTNTTGNVPTTGEITGRPDIITYTTTSLTVTPNNAPNEFIWWAIPVTGSAFTKWFNIVGNDGNIGASEFVRLNGIIALNGTNYEIYITNSPSAIDGTLRLH